MATDKYDAICFVFLNSNPAKIDRKITDFGIVIKHILLVVRNRSKTFKAEYQER